MFGTPIRLDDLRACLASVAPVELKGMRLLEAQPHLLSGTAHIPRAQLIEAVTEIVAYTERCTAAARQLEELTPIPVMRIEIWDYGL